MWLALNCFTQINGGGGGTFTNTVLHPEKQSAG